VCFLDEGEKRIWSACEVCVWEDRLSARYVSIVLLNMDKLLSLATIPCIVVVKKYHYNNSLLPQTSTVVDAKESTGVLLAYRTPFSNPLSNQIEVPPRCTESAPTD
jgi:hypothetical protein